MWFFKKIDSMKYFLIFSFSSYVLSLNILKNNIENDVSLSDCLESVTSNYFQKAKSISVIKLSDAEYSLPKMKTVLIITRKNFTKTLFLEQHVIIFDKDQLFQNVLQNISRNFRTKFIVVTDEKNISNVISSFWKLRILSLLILVPKREVIDILTYNPFNVQNCNDLTVPKLINKWNRSLKKFEAPWMILKESGDFKVDYMKCPLNISFMDLPPFVIRDNNLKEISHLGGIEGLMMTVIASKLNFTPKYINRHESEYGKFEPIPSGLVGDLYTGRSDIGFGVLFPFPVRYVKLDGAVAYNLQEVGAWAVPIGAGSTIPPWLQNIILEFTPFTWSAIILTCIISALFFKFLNRLSAKLNNQKPITFDFYFLTSLFIGQGSYQFSYVKVLLFIASWLWFGFVIISLYQCSMSSRITAPFPPSNIKTIEQLVYSKLEITGPINALLAVKSAAEDKDEVIFKKLYELSKPTNVSILNALLRIAKERNMAYQHHASIFEYYAAFNREITGNVYIVDEGVYPHYPAILFPKHSFLAKYVSRIIGRLNDCGLIEKLTRDFKIVAASRGDVGLFSLSVVDVYGAFLILIAGWVGSSFIFWVELMLGKFFASEIGNVDKNVEIERGTET